MKTTVVTGAAGFIGSAVTRALENAGHRVTRVALGSHDPLTASRLAALGAFDMLVHCAGTSSVGASLADPSREHARTVPPFEAVLEHVRANAPGARVVFVSSAAVYGNAELLPTPETALIAPVSPYGEHKRQCEELCMRFGELHGVASAIVRLFSVYGPGLRKQLLWDSCRKALVGDTVFAGTGDEERDFLHVDDAAALLVAAGERAAPGVPIFNGASGVGVKVRDVVDRVFAELGAPNPRFSGTTRAGDPPRYVADISRARAIGWSPRIDLARGIADYVRWFQEQE